MANNTRRRRERERESAKDDDRASERQGRVGRSAGVENGRGGGGGDQEIVIDTFLCPATF